VFHSLSQRPEREQRIAGGELEPPCYGSVRPVVWGLGVKIPWLPDSLSFFIMHDIENERNLKNAAIAADDAVRKSDDWWRRAPELDHHHAGSDAWRHFWTGSVRWVTAKISSENVRGLPPATGGAPSIQV
jgi:hypothetical protein